MATWVIKLSGSGGRQRFGGMTKAEVTQHLLKIEPKLRFIDHGAHQANYIVFPDGLSPSATALKTGGKPQPYTKFLGILKARHSRAKATNTTPKKATAKKATAKKATAKKATAKKATAKKATVKKATSKKATSKKSTVKKATAKKPTAKKATAKKATAKQATAKKNKK
jgi:hypothetical protein